MQGNAPPEQAAQQASSIKQKNQADLGGSGGVADVAPPSKQESPKEQVGDDSAVGTDTEDSSSMSDGDAEEGWSPSVLQAFLTSLQRVGGEETEAGNAPPLERILTRLDDLTTEPVSTNDGDSSFLLSLRNGSLLDLPDGPTFDLLTSLRNLVSKLRKQAGVDTCSCVCSRSCSLLCNCLPIFETPYNDLMRGWVGYIQLHIEAEKTQPLLPNLTGHQHQQK